MKVRPYILALPILLIAMRALGGVSLTLAVEPTHVLPGIAPALHVAIVNDGANDVRLPEKLLLRVIPSSGKPFIAEWGAGQEQRYSRAELPGRGEGKVVAHSTATFTFTSYALDRGPGWFYDLRLNAPGTYRLQLLLVDSFRESTVFQTPALNLESAVAIRLASTEAVLTVDTPRGDDAKLWDDLRRIAQHHGAETWSPLFWGEAGWREFVRDAVEKYPSSPYAAFVIRDYAERSAGDRLSPEERLFTAQQVLKSQPTTPIREDLQLFMAEMEITAAEHAASALEPDWNRAASMYERARSDLEALERTARDPLIRGRSKEEREHLPSPAELREAATHPRN